MVSATRPRIGITYSPKRPGEYYEPYVRAGAAAGAEPVLVAATAAAQRDAAAPLRGLDGLLLPGGWDMDPASYGERRSDMLGTTDLELDQFEIGAVSEAVRAGLPVMGICRGQQVLNVALGGTLHQHVSGHDGRHQARTRLAHSIDVEQNSELRRATGAGILMVNSLHHQAIKDLGSGLRVTANSLDGVVEGVEGGDRIVAVQCHPEELVNERRWALRLLQRLVERAARKGQHSC